MYNSKFKRVEDTILETMLAEITARNTALGGLLKDSLTITSTKSTKGEGDVFNCLIDRKIFESIANPTRLVFELLKCIWNLDAELIVKQTGLVFDKELQENAPTVVFSTNQFTEDADKSAAVLTEVGVDVKLFSQMTKDYLIEIMEKYRRAILDKETDICDLAFTESFTTMVKKVVRPAMLSCDEAMVETYLCCLGVVANNPLKLVDAALTKLL